jgi:hypothetical protein
MALAGYLDSEAIGFVDCKPNQTLQISNFVNTCVYLRKNSVIISTKYYSL